MSGAMQAPKKASTASREAYFLEFAEKVRAAVAVPLMVTGGFRTAAGMNAALRSGALDVVDLARLLAIDPLAPAALLQGRDSDRQVRPISTGLKAVGRIKALLDIVLHHSTDVDSPAVRERALATAATMIGAVVLARAVDEPALSDAVLHAVRRHLVVVP